MMAQGIDPVTHVVVDVPNHGTFTIERGALGHELGRGFVLVSQNMTPEQVRQTLRHEINHALRGAAAPGSIEEYRDEFDASWMDGSFDHLKPARRAIEIRKYVLEQYEALGKAFVDDPDFAKNVKDYTRPLGNTHNSVAWRDAEIELTSGNPNREQQVLTDLAAAPAHERAILAADENFIKMLQQHASPEFVAQVRKVLAK
jgi:hypothetical protein